MAVTTPDHERLLDAQIIQRKTRHVVGIRSPGLTAKQSHFWMIVKKCDLFLKTLGKRYVVMVHDGEVLALSHGKQPVARTGDTQIALIYGINDAPILIGPHHIFHLRVGGGIIQNEKFKIRERLRKNAVHRFAQMFRTGIVHRHEYGNTRHGQSLKSSALFEGMPNRILYLAIR